MRRLSPVARALVAAAVGAAAAVIFVIAVYSCQRPYTLALDRERLAIASGMYDTDRDGDHVQAWTARRALLALHGASRSVAWTCHARLRNGWPENIAPPVVTIEVDGAPIAQRTLTHSFEDVDFIAAPRSTSGLQVAIVTTPTYKPGGEDRRELGVQLEALSCGPSGALVVLPPARAMMNAAMAAAIFGAAFGLTAMATVPAVASAVVVAAAQAFPIAFGPGPYTIGFQNDIVWLATCVAAALLVLARGLEWIVGVMRGASLFGLGATAVILYAKLLAITHPSKLLIDAVFHAHRLEYVMAGNYFFTQPIQNGVQFPYAIALYVFAWPWTAFTSDHVTLLRVVVLGAEALAGCVLFRMTMKGWGDSLAGALAVALFAAVPLSYVVVGNANLTNAFGQAVALMALAAATTWSFDGRFVSTGALTALIAVALLAHVSTLMLLLATLGLLLALYFFFLDERSTLAKRRPTLAIAIATTLAVVCAVGLYYGHFGDAYRTLAAVRSSTPTPGAAASPSVPISVRASQALSWTVWSIGWPMILLAGAGAWRLGTIGIRNRVGLAVVALGLTYLFFVGFTVLSPVDPKYVRYADEFIVRTVYATYPAVVLLAALGSAWAIRAGGVGRVAGITGLAWAAFDGVTQWMNWLR